MRRVDPTSEPVSNVASITERAAPCAEVVADAVDAAIVRPSSAEEARGVSPSYLRQQLFKAVARGGSGGAI